MEVKFDVWNEQKRWINKNKKAPFFNEWEVWWCRIGINIWKKSYLIFPQIRLVSSSRLTDKIVDLPQNEVKDIKSWAWKYFWF